MPHKGLQQAYDVQDVAYDAVMAWKKLKSNEQGEIVLPEYAAGELAQLIKAWDIAQDRVRIQRGKPLPGALKPEPKRKPVKASDLSSLLPMPDPEATHEAQAASS